MLEKQIADKIKKIRKAKGYTLDHLGKLTCLSKGLLSRIENYQVSPPIATLSKISHGLGVPIGTFFDSEETTNEQSYAVTLKNERRHVNRRGLTSELNYYSLSGWKSNSLIEPFVVKYSATDKKPTKLYDHTGEEFLLVLKGKIDFKYGKKTIRLETGDSIHFNPLIPHRGQNAGKTESECLVIVIEDVKR
ncbi:MAG: helix-turn-helix transcriptional regulator [Deltaproteobacteria bacterium]|nr:helix-turn-helix transcriptional regulator [Deltaproteobacteria bacterium]